jgi:hypothetical protein
MGKGGSSSVALLRLCGLLFGVVALIVAAGWYVVRQRDDLRRPRVLPGGYTIARYTHQGADGSWGITPPGKPFDSPVLLNADGSEESAFWCVTKLAIAGDMLIGTGRLSSSGGELPIAFELDTRTHRAVKLQNAWEADRRLAELMFEQPPDAGTGWVDIYELPRAPRQKK